MRAELAAALVPGDVIKPPYDRWRPHKVTGIIDGFIYFEQEANAGLISRWTQEAELLYRPKIVRVSFQ